jgi:UPF0716 family protein affecting phage T7 exclusion
MFSVIAFVAIVYTVVDIGVSVYVVRRLGVDEAGRRVRALFA